MKVKVPTIKQELAYYLKMQKALYARGGAGDAYDERIARLRKIIANLEK